MKNHLRIIFYLLFLATASCGGGDGYTGVAESDEDNITISMTLANLPETVMVNRDGTARSSTEYAWEVILDVDRDGTESAGDVKLNLSWFKFGLFPESSEYQQDIDTFVAVATVIPEEGQPGFFFHPFSPTITGNTITFSLPKSLTQSSPVDVFANVSMNNLIQFKTTYQDDEGNFHHDYYPFQNGFDQIPVTGEISDLPDEPSTGGYGFIDLLSMKVSLN